MNTMSLPTFLKYMDLPLHLKAAELRRRSQNKKSGYNFYHTLQASALLMFQEDLAYDEVVSHMGPFGTVAERNANVEALRCLHKWKTDNPGTYFAPPRSRIVGQAWVLAVSLRPDFGWETEKGKELIVLRAHKDPALPQRTGQLGAHALQTRLAKDNFNDCNCFVLDILRGKKFGFKPDRIEINEAMLMAEVAQQEDLYNVKAA
jgi:hypothetical protein